MDEQKDRDPQPKVNPSVRRLLRDVLVFQFKLAMDGFRDIVLSPVSILVAIYGVVVKPSNPSVYFQSLLKFGRKSDDFINLFNHNTPADKKTTPPSDEYVEKIETLVTERIKKRDIGSHPKVSPKKSPDTND
jgi:hypothetical protein